MITSLRILATSLLMFLFSCNHPNVDDEQQRNKKIVRVIYNMFETGDLTGVEEYVSVNMVEHTPDPLILQEGIEGLKEVIRLNHIAFPDLKLKVFNISAEGDLVYSHFNFSGSNSGPIRESAPTKKFIDIDGVDIIRVKDGKIVEHWGYWDTLKFINQLGEEAKKFNYN